MIYDIKQLHEEGNWEKIRIELENRHPTLDEETLAYVPGNEERLIERIADSINESTDTVRNEIIAINNELSKR